MLQRKRRPLPPAPCCATNQPATQHQLTVGIRVAGGCGCRGLVGGLQAQAAHSQGIIKVIVQQAPSHTLLQHGTLYS